MDQIINAINEKKPKTAIVVGGGFIGLEVVEALQNRGIQTSIIE